MKILTVDIGTGTQDIFLYDSQLSLENGFKLVVPSPTMIIHKLIKDATRKRETVLLSGVIMGGGPSAWAAEQHVNQGLALFATPEAARSFNDDLEKVIQTGIQIVSEEEAHRLSDHVRRIEMRDFDFASIAAVFERFGISLKDLAAVAVGVFDHGNAPPDVSDRQFRFDYLDGRIRAENRLSAFAYPAERIPSIMTRLRAVAAATLEQAPAMFDNIPLIVMDTAPAAVLGATYDPIVRARQRVLIVNIGNFHTLAFRLGPTGIEGVFEHHTGLVDQTKLEYMLTSFADGTLTHAEIFEDHGHGALIYNNTPLIIDTTDQCIVVTGPQRLLMRDSKMHPYFAVPFGDMMLSGCFGLLSAVADVRPDMRETITNSLDQRIPGLPPWEIA